MLLFFLHRNRTSTLLKAYFYHSNSDTNVQSSPSSSTELPFHVKMTGTDERTPLLANQVRLQTTRESHNINENNTNSDEQLQVLETAEEVQKVSDSIKENIPKSLLFTSVIALYSGLLISAIDSTLVISIIGPITSTFGAADRAFWITTAYALTLGSFSPIFGRLFDILGRRSCLQAATAIFALGTAICILSPSMEILIIGRAIQGIGGAGLQPGSAIVINDLIPLRSRGYFHALGQLVYSIGFSLGGPLGGLINDWIGWRASFTVQIPPILLAFFLISIFLKTPKFPITKAQYQRQQAMQGKPLHVILWKRCDPLGTTMMISAVIMLLLTFSLISQFDLSFSDVEVWAGFSITIVLFIAFIYVEARIAEEPIMPLKFITKREFSSIFISYTLFSSFNSTVFYFPFYFIVLFGKQPAEIGIRFFPFSVATLSGAFFVGWFLRKTGKYRNLSIILVFFSLVTPLYMITWTETNLPSVFGQFFSLVPAGFTLSGLNTVLMVALVANAGQQDSTGAVALTYLLRTCGLIVGLSASGSLIQKVLVVELNKRIQGKHAQETIDLIRRYIEKIHTLPDKERRAAEESYARALQVFQWSFVAIIVLNMVSVSLIKEKSLGGPKQVSEEVEEAEEASQERQEEGL